MKQLIGKKFNRVVRTDNEIAFFGKVSFKLCHMQDCCEDVYISDVCGDLADLEDAVIYDATEEYTEDKEASESGTWSFYKIQSSKGCVTIRFNGSSNGYYSERANLWQEGEWY